jgi:hypothetical protein
VGVSSWSASLGKGPDVWFCGTRTGPIDPLTRCGLGWRIGSPNSLSQRTLVMIIVETVTRLLYGT